MSDESEFCRQKTNSLHIVGGARRPEDEVFETIVKQRDGTSTTIDITRLNLASCCSTGNPAIVAFVGAEEILIIPVNDFAGATAVRKVAATPADVASRVERIG